MALLISKNHERFITAASSWSWNLFHQDSKSLFSDTLWQCNNNTKWFLSHFPPLSCCPPAVTSGDSGQGLSRQSSEKNDFITIHFYFHSPSLLTRNMETIKDTLNSSDRSAVLYSPWGAWEIQSKQSVKVVEQRLNNSQREKLWNGSKERDGRMFSEADMEGRQFGVWGIRVKITKIWMGA